MLIDYPIIARNLTYKAGFKKIIEDISLVLMKNEFVGLIGGSGSGKTTLLTCLNGYREPSDGKVVLNGIPGREKDKIRRLIGYVPQDDVVHKTLTVERALYYSYLLRVDYEVSEEEIEKTVSAILEQLDLTGHRSKKISSLSGGQRKRVSIGVELLHSPELFFLDEPTAGLDPSLEKQLMTLLSTLADENRLIMITTHLMQNIDLFDVLIFIHKGSVIYFGPGSEIKSFFQAQDMVEVFEKTASQHPQALRNKYRMSAVYNKFLIPRLEASRNVR